MSREDIEATVENNPRMIPLVDRVLFYAGMAMYDDTVLALGTALADAFSDPDEADVTELVVKSLAELGRYEAQVLATLCDKPFGEYADYKSASWTTERVRDATGLSDTVIDLSVAGLRATGLVKPSNMWAGFSVTELGRTVLEVIRVARESAIH